MQQSLRSWSKTTRISAAAIFGCTGLWAYSSYGRKNREGAGTLNPASFTPFTLTNREAISESNVLLTLRGPLSSRTSTERGGGPNAAIQELWKQGVWSVEIKQPQLMIARRYTPLPLLSGKADDPPQISHESNQDSGSDITLLVRRAPQGEVSRYLHSLPLGAAAEVRGGYMEFRLPDDTDEVVFLAGGTGIAPALQIAHVLRQRGVQARMKLLWANRHSEECSGAIDTRSNDRSWRDWFGLQGLPSENVPEQDPGTTNPIVRQLQTLSSSTHREYPKASSGLTLSVKYFVDEQNSFIRLGDIKRALTAESSPGGQKVIIISGPEGFIDYLAGPKRLVNGIETQGALGGLLSRTDTRGWEVWKL